VTWTGKDVGDRIPLPRKQGLDVRVDVERLKTEFGKVEIEMAEMNAGAEDWRDDEKRELGVVSVES
jgi:hypothetical protein